MKPGTGLTILGTAVGSAKLVEKLLGPTADYLGEGLRQWTEKRVENVLTGVLPTKIRINRDRSSRFVRIPSAAPSGSQRVDGLVFPIFSSNSTSRAAENWLKISRLMNSLLSVFNFAIRSVIVPEGWLRVPPHAYAPNSR